MIFDARFVVRSEPEGRYLDVAPVLQSSNYDTYPEEEDEGVITPMTTPQKGTPEKVFEYLTSQMHVSRIYMHVSLFQCTFRDIFCTF